MTDADAIRASYAHAAAFEAVFDRHFDAIHRYLSRRVGVDLADELAAEAFAVAFRKRRRYDASRADARPRLYGIATNLVSRHRRTEERELRAYARTGLAPAAGDHRDDELFTLVGDVLRSAPLPSDLRAALYRVAARIPGIHLIGEVRDTAGRGGVGVAFDDPARRRILIFDPQTAELLGEQSVLLEPGDYLDAAPGTVVGEAAYLEAGVVDSTRERP
jgi:DNA-directed RNA polymerase specialized sigma24 family protein